MHDALFMDERNLSIVKLGVVKLLSQIIHQAREAVLLAVLVRLSHPDTGAGTSKTSQCQKKGL
jgi:hypothetical protein